MTKYLSQHNCKLQVYIELNEKGSYLEYSKQHSLKKISEVNDKLNLKTQAMNEFINRFFLTINFVKEVFSNRYYHADYITEAVSTSSNTWRGSFLAYNSSNRSYQSFG